MSDGSDQYSSSFSPPWAEDAKILKIWFLAYIALLILGWGAILVPPYLDHLSESAKTAFSVAAFFGFGVCLIPYIASLVYAYRVQKRLNDEKLWNSGAWQVIVLGVIVTPRVLGPLIPGGVLGKAKDCTAMWQRLSASQS